MTSTLTGSRLVIGETSNPSTWSHRLPVLVLALLGCGISAYLTLYQWHVTASVWDPLFGASSTESVLTSFVSRLLPVPDATLGAAAVPARGFADRARRC